MRRPVALVTGASDGLGLETARILGQAGWSVLVHGRHARRAQDACATLRADGPDDAYHPVHADFGSLREITQLAAELATEPLDAVVNNAGVFAPNAHADQRRISADGHELHWAVNYLAAFALTTALAPRLARTVGSRVIGVCSTFPLKGGMRWDDLELSGTWDRGTAYAQSKMALAMFTLEFAERSGCAANCVSPGYVDTKLVRQAFGGAVVPAEVGAAYIARPLLNPEWRGLNGCFFDRDRLTEPPAPAGDPGARRRLWELTEAGLGHLSQR
jgi:NAD(P)-dependent dehydrogenase (short-subunit alcohol dehydrogenase family)